MLHRPITKDQLNSLRRGELKRLFRARYGGPTLPDGPNNRANLQLMLELGLTGPEAHRLAPWAGEDLEPIINASVGNWGYWANSGQRLADLIGNRVDLTFEEYKLYGPFKHITPIDVDRHVVQTWKRQRELERDRERKRNARKAIRPGLVSSIDDRRCKAVYLLLEPRDWRSVSQLIDALDGHPQFKDGRGRKLCSASRRKAVNRVLDKLVSDGFVEDEEPRLRTANGLAIRRVLRLRG
jgi:hypothetical protein